jgi:RNA polymerase sigma-70 factor (ECF subfamily)
MTPDRELIVRFRPLLYLHARQMQFGRLYHTRFDASDIVSETCVKALGKLDQIRGRSEPEFIQWLRKVLESVVMDWVRRITAARRDVRLERSLEEAAGDRSTPLGAYQVASDPGPSTIAGKQEDLLRLAAAIEQLSEIEQDVVIGHCILQLPVAEVARRVGRTERAVAGVLFRAKLRLRGLFGEGDRT